jgi:uncharacterized membrane protein YkvA (DUF1232 family)
MNRRESTGGSQSRTPDTGLVIDLLRQFKLIWRLLKDRRVPLWMKAIPFLSLAYLLVPTDLVPDILLGLGQLDDMAVLALGVKLFTELVPEQVVQEHREELAAEEHGWTVVEGEAEQLDDPQS